MQTDDLKKLALSFENKSKKIRDLAPLYEYAKNISIFTSDENGNYNTFSIDELLPNPFG